MWDKLDHIDKSLFLSINGWNSPASDQFWIFASSNYFWLLIYIPALYYGIVKFKYHFLWIVLAAATLYLITDQGANFFKAFVERPRPCRVEELKNFIHFLAPRCSEFGFFSGHAANAAGQATFLILTSVFSKRITRSIIPLWALSVGLSRIFLGVHYPGDIVAGWLFGITAAYLAFTLLNLLFIRLYKCSLPNWH